MLASEGLAALLARLRQLAAAGRGMCSATAAPLAGAVKGDGARVLARRPASLQRRGRRPEGLRWTQVRLGRPAEQWPAAPAACRRPLARLHDNVRRTT